ncbi:tRNA (guanosine(46)-N7)-methyltransferase TrmB [Salipaludibacillus neizhouensis]|uniref:tRNA (guanine-N(7)-)-methyltransferase n=1 Tax=Salipaludibacillus neizhouensis TaxID=885475 RepID=A0A3A9KB22_9BACI|nr:tRNA (guanosine(46)-N7)-methyltransferase TrmB [Salipaludibacillus neizhouensis]RKL66773.1 tRNA (guanosine(46)-N7)-methyltransferase TrmB [Salipaludibacillus neizhouensis]
MRLRNKPWAMEFIDSHPEIREKNPKSWQGKWDERFNKAQPLFVEVGTGKGKFVTDMAKEYPDTNFIGIEKYESIIVSGVQRVIDEPVDNLLFLQENAHNITDFFGAKEVDRIYINFTDPWPKNRHEKRRLTNKFFLEKYEEILKENGEIHFKTDNQALFEYSIESLTDYGFLLKNVSLDLHNSDMKDNIMTEYEEKFSEKGMRIYRLEASLRKQ